jgi:hypothetical protein
MATSRVSARSTPLGVLTALVRVIAPLTSSPCRSWGVEQVALHSFLRVLEVELTSVSAGETIPAGDAVGP